MHKCVNKSVGNVYHLEQWVDKFFPYSQEQLGFDRPVNIVFQSDENNASRMLGKTAHYDPQNMEVVLYVDNRHPKDIMRSLSHELVHHAQNCRGEFNGGCDKSEQNESCAQDTPPGYAQTDPHMRNMEREAYTKGNLIFRDFEDLIKTGKINIEIDFSNSGEPKMSLKESRSVNFNKNLMKKWGLLKEAKEEVAATADVTEATETEEVTEATETEEVTESEETETETLAEESGEDEAWHQWKNEHADDDHIKEIEHHLRALKDDRDHERDEAEYDHDKYEDEGDHDLEEGWGYRKDDRKGYGKNPGAFTPGNKRKTQQVDQFLAKESAEESRKITVREAKEIAARIVERLRKETK